MSRSPKAPIRNTQVFNKAVVLKSQSEVAALFMQGIALHQQGQLAQAKLIYTQVLSKQPAHSDALHLSGVIAAQSNNPTLAVELIGKAIEINPMSAEAYSNRGNALKELNRLEEAVASYDRAIEIKPDYTQAYYNRGNALQELEQFDGAIASFDSAIEIKPDYAEAYYNRGVAFQELKRFEEAVASYNRAIEIKPDYAEAYYNLGIAFHELKRFEEAVASYNRAIEIKPHYAEAHSNRGNALKELNRLGEAVASFDRAIEIKPDYAESHSNRGNALKELNRLGEAVASYNRAIEIKPDYAEAYYNLGIAFQELKRFDAALASYDKAIELKSDYNDAYQNRGLLRLRLKDFQKGFLDYKYRWGATDFSSKPQKTTIASALKSGLKGRLLIWAEQGLGDEIFFAGLLPTFYAEDVSITLSADKRLHPIYRRSLPKIKLLDKNILMSSSVDTGFDAQAPIGDLGLLLDIKATAIKATRSPYLQCDPVKRDSYRRTTSALGSGLICGVAWKSVNKKLGPAKSIGLDSFAPLLGLTGIHFINLQYGDVKDEIQHVKSTLSVDVHQVPDVDAFNDIESLLALIDACDVIVTTSNVTAHLAGSIGKRAAVLVPHSKGKIWYWHENDEYSFWYPSLKLFYQDNPLTWDQTIEDCSDWVKSLL
jgi:tetratricopeptide (TPR) repeat protein